MTCRSKIAKNRANQISKKAAMAAIFENLFFASSPELKGQLTSKHGRKHLGGPRRSKIAKICADRKSKLTAI